MKIREQLGVVFVVLAVISILLALGSAYDGCSFTFPALACWMAEFVDVSSLQIARPLSLMFTIIAIILTRHWPTVLVLLTLFVGMFVLTGFQCGFYHGDESNEERLARQCPSD